MNAAREVTMPDLKIRVRAGGAHALVTVDGELDLGSAPRLRRRLDAVGAGDVVVDLSGLRFFDAAGLRVLLDLRARLERAQARVVLVAVPDCVQRVLTVTGTAQVFTTAPDAADAAELLDGSRERTGSAT